MVAIRINGTDSPVRTDGLPRFTDIVELIKTVIDPEHVITDMRINGEVLSDEVWASSTATLGTSIIEVETDTVKQFVEDRLIQAPGVVQACYVQFRDARKAFQMQGQILGNKKLATAVGTLQAFFSWYATFFPLIPAHEQPQYDLDKYVKSIVEISNKICQQQLYQSWWAIAQTIEKELEPQLDELENFCRKFTQRTGGH